MTQQEVRELVKSLKGERGKQTVADSFGDMNTSRTKELRRGARK